MNWIDTIKDLEKVYGSQKNLARSLNVSSRAIRYWKAGTNQITKPFRVKLSYRKWYYTDKLRKIAEKIKPHYPLYRYLFSVRYDEKGNRGSHPVHLEVEVETGRRQSEEDLRMVVESYLIREHKTDLMAIFTLTLLVGMEEESALSRVTTIVNILVLDRNV